MEILLRAGAAAMYYALRQRNGEATNIMESLVPGDELREAGEASLTEQQANQLDASNKSDGSDLSIILMKVAARLGG